MLTQTSLLTVDDLLQLPNEGRGYELVRGELREMSPSKPRHGRVAGQLAWRLGQYVTEHNLGAIYIAEAGFILTRNPDTVRVPDVAFVRRERFEAIGDTDDFWPEAPDLVVEVVSPNDRPVEVLEKAHNWLAAGTQMVIVIEAPKRRVTVYHALAGMTVLTDTDVLEGGDVVPGWAMAVRDLFV